VALGLLAASTLGVQGGSLPAGTEAPWQVEIRSLARCGPGGATSFLHPLDEIEITVKAPVPTAQMRIVVSDGRDRAYHHAQLGSLGRPAVAKTAVRGSLGQHTVRLFQADRCVGKWPVEVRCVTGISTGQADWDAFYPTMRAIVQNNMTSMCIHNRVLKGCAAGDVVWLRDHTHMMKAFRYWEADLVELVDHFLSYQRDDGSYFDYTRQYKDLPGLNQEVELNARMKAAFKVEPQRLLLSVRVGVEADLEYLAVEAVYYVWQATGDDRWMESALGKLEKGMGYAMSSPLRWSAEHKLVKRPFTIDSWDFEYGQPPTPAKGPKLHSRREIDGDTRYCIMHGDNSGMFKACLLLSRMFGRTGQAGKADHWRRVADQFRRQMNRVCWNGRFYTHQVHLDPVKVPGVDERRQLSLSNPLDINRGVCDHGQAVSILDEYRRRRATTRAFAEWFSLDPPFPDGVFGFPLEPGRYVNGGILPMVGGELARAAFEHGREDYGVDILRRYYRMVSENHETCFAYFASGPRDPRIEFPGNGWGAAVMIHALVEGLAGISDEASQYREVKIAPRWVAAGVRHARCCARYAASNAYFAYRYRHDPAKREITLVASGSGAKVDYHVLLPQGAAPEQVSCGGQATAFRRSLVENSPYVDFSAAVQEAEVRITYATP
jgi:hypothetical protein